MEERADDTQSSRKRFVEERFEVEKFLSQS